MARPVPCPLTCGWRDARARVHAPCARGRRGRRDPRAGGRLLPRRAAAGPRRRRARPRRVRGRRRGLPDRRRAGAHGDCVRGRRRPRDRVAQDPGWRRGRSGARARLLHGDRARRRAGLERRPARREPLPVPVRFDPHRDVGRLLARARARPRLPGHDRGALPRPRRRGARRGGKPRRRCEGWAAQHDGRGARRPDDRDLDAGGRDPPDRRADGPAGACGAARRLEPALDARLRDGDRPRVGRLRARALVLRRPRPGRDDRPHRRRRVRGGGARRRGSGVGLRGAVPVRVGARPPRDRIGRPSGEAVGLEERRGDIRGGLLVDPHRLVHCGDRLHAQ